MFCSEFMDFHHFIGNKVIQTLIKDVSSEMMNKSTSALEWTQANYTYLSEPLLFAVLISLFTIMIIYFDSDIPGVSPPTPFSPRKAHQYVMILFNHKYPFVLSTFQ